MGQEEDMKLSRPQNHSSNLRHMICRQPTSCRDSTLNKFILLLRVPTKQKILTSRFPLFLYKILFFLSACTRTMRIGCDVCRTAAAAVICCADEAALCARCDEEVHAANMLAGKHRRLPLHCDASKLPRCDICQDKSAFIFCVEDRALFCQDCDEAIHIPGTLSANHQRLLATGICVGLNSVQNTDCTKHHPEPPSSKPMASKLPAMNLASSTSAPTTWAVDDFLQLTDYKSSYKDSSDGLEGLTWFTDISFPSEQASIAAEVPEMGLLQSSNDEPFYRPSRSNMPYKKPRIDMLIDEDFFTVPDLG